jgi:hypothetical protein
MNADATHAALRSCVIRAVVKIEEELGKWRKFQ